MFAFFFDTGQALASQSANLYMDTVINTALPSIIGNERLEPTRLSDFIFEYKDKIIGIKVKGKAEYTEGLMNGLSKVKRFSDCEGPINIPGRTSINCTLVFPNLEINHKGKVKYGKVPKVTINPKGNIQNVLIKVGIVKSVSESYPKVQTFSFTTTGLMTTHFTGLGPLNKQMKILEENYRKVVGTEVLNVIQSRFQYALNQAVASVPMPLQ